MPSGEALNIKESNLSCICSLEGGFSLFLCLYIEYDCQLQAFSFLTCRVVFKINIYWEPFLPIFDQMIIFQDYCVMGALVLNANATFGESSNINLFFKLCCQNTK